MDVTEYVLSAGKAVLDMMEREWQPLNAVELEHQLDKAVEQILESDLASTLKRKKSPCIYEQLTQSQANAAPQMRTESGSAEAVESQPKRDSVDDAAVQHISELLQSSKAGTRMAGRARLSLSHTVLLSLTLLSERVSYRAVSDRFQLEKGNIHRIFFSFCERINRLEEKLIRWPVGSDAAETLVPFSSLLGKGEQENGKGVPQVLGVLGHTWIPIRLPVGKRVMERAKMKMETHPGSWLRLELVCDHRGQILHCRAGTGLEDGRGTSLRNRLAQQPDLTPSGSFLVARAGYPLTPQILTPYENSCGRKEELFNQTLEEHFGTFDQAVAKLKARFQRLKYLDVGNFERARAVVLTACVLHNVFLNTGQEFEGPFETEEAPIPEREVAVDEEGILHRDGVAELLFKNVNSARI
uniref:Elongin B n=2 Tax=Oryzias latipes TaxID=8090 RepID=H2L9S9_ORYLA